MIRRHDFNTQWWGAPAGIVDDAAFFALPAHEREAALAPYQWVEFKSGFDATPPLTLMTYAGFSLADIQIVFRIALKEACSSCSESLTVRFAGEPGFEYCAADLAPFAHERFAHLPGSTSEQLSARYGTWGSQLIREYPDTCLAVLADGEVQGWFFSQPAARGLSLTLAAAHRRARVSGLLLYEKSLAAYAAKGFRIGRASFSVTNTAVHNIYAKLGARFTRPTGIWLWLAPGI